MVNNDLKIDLDFDSIINQKDELQKSRSRKRNISDGNLQSNSPSKQKTKHDSPHVESHNSQAISISFTYDQIQLHINYYPINESNLPTISEILNEVKKKI
jgi:hypothetical protein